MKVLVVTNQFPSKTFNYKGSFVFQQVKELKNLVDNIYVVTPNYGKDKKFEVIENIPVYRFKSFTRKVKDPLLRILFKGILGKISLLFFMLSQILKIYSVVRKKKIDIIHAHWILPSGTSSLIVSILSRKRLVLTSHGSDLTYCSNYKVFRWFLKITIKKCATFIGDTNYLTEIAYDLYNHPSKFNTIHLGVSDNVNEFRKQSTEQTKKKRKKSLIFVGSLYPLKGAEYLLESVLFLSKKRDDFICRIVGDGVLYDQLQSFILDNKLKNFCELKGFLSHDETLKLISNSDIAIQTSLSEGLSVFIQESIFLGKPVIATDVGGTKDIVEDGFNGFLIEPKDVKELANKLTLLLDDENRIRKMGINSLKIAEEKLILEKNVRKIADIYREIKN